ncbi:hypothetical protein ONS95_005271 [Cadophora gregata]|uniref:uncharacterized protein n=1 Tax=Cadophora gregata TaxID=51156 RepID=UPI0026DAC83A|nr:uncharacterized protein ONS95_005271 [Cadophora gregata]KAK0103237.1 hypothetical protein ONS95_005271 [Cadophora gregata]
MQLVDVSSHAFASLKSKAAKVPKLRRDKKTKQEPELEIHEPVLSETVEPVTESTPTIQPFDIPRPVHAKKTQADTPPVNVPIPVLQPIDIPKPVHAKPVKAEAAAQPATAPAPASAPAPATTATPTLQPFDIPKPVHAKKASWRSPPKKDKSKPTPTTTQPAPQPNEPNEPTHIVSQLQTLAATTPSPYPPPSTHPLFPAPPTYMPPTLPSRIKTHLLHQLPSHILSSIGILFLLLTYLLHTLRRLFTIRSFSGPQHRPFAAEESRRAELRKIDAIAWKKHDLQRKSTFADIAAAADVEANAGAGAVGALAKDGYVPSEGGEDKFLVDVGYYARRVGLDSEEVKVQTEDGFVLDLWHVFDPREYTPLSRAQRMVRGPECIDEIRGPSREVAAVSDEKEKGKEGEGEANKRRQKYPVLMMPGLMQSSGVYCTDDDHSLAFWLCKQGYDVWLGNNRCGFEPEHVEFKKGDPRMWNWNITHMATLDLPALTARVLSETSCSTLGLIAHSQGTTQTLIALSKHQRPSISAKISVFCALAPAAYTGPLLDHHPFKLLRQLPTPLFRLILGRKSFLPILTIFSLLRGRLLPHRLLGTLSYQIYAYLFSWTDTNWDSALRHRHFLFAPTRISSLAMQWWLSKQGFAHHGSILSSHEQVQREVEEDLLQDYFRNVEGRIEEDFATSLLEKHVREPRAPESWFADGVGDGAGGRTPPMAFWIGGEDTLCDGRELLNRFERGREPGVRILEGGRNVIQGYSHLDVVWACDVIERVGLGVRDAVWRSVGKEGRERFRLPKGCEAVEEWVDDRAFGSGGVEKREGSTDLEDSESEKEEGKEGVEKTVSDKEMVD